MAVNPPLDEPVLVDLGLDDDALEIEAQQPEPKKAVPDEKKPDEEDPVIASLKARIAESEAAAEEAKKQARAEAEARATAEQALTQSRSYASDTEASAIEYRLYAAQTEAMNAKAAWKSAYETGDAQGLADANEKIAAAAADVREWERAKNEHAHRKEQAKQQAAAAPQQTSAPRDVNEMIDAMQLLPAERVWLKAHPETLMDRGRNIELDAAYIKATRKGIVRGTPDYFKFLETELGYAKPEDTVSNTQVSAPVTRSAPSGRSMQVRLSPQQREIAAMLGLSDKEYAEGYVQMEADKRANPEKYAQR